MFNPAGAATPLQIDLEILKQAHLSCNDPFDDVNSVRPAW